MKSEAIYIRLVTLAITCLAFVTFGAVADEEMPSSGFLPAAMEGKLEQVELSDGRKAMRWISPALTKANYDAVMVDRVIYYPAPNPGPQVSSSALENIADYLTESLRKYLGTSVKVVDKAGPRVLRMQPAITAVVVDKEGLSVKDVVPVHLLFSAAKAATGNMAEDVTAMVEVRVTDSMTRDYRAAVKMNVEGEQLKGEKDQLTVGDFKKALDKRAEVGANAIREALSE
jgi:hypothetical protein